MVPRWLSLVALVAILALGACEVDGEVAVDVDGDGSGRVAVTVRLGAEAAERLGDLSNLLVVEDLTDAGWRIDRPRRVDGGAVVVRATKGFATPKGLAPTLAEVTGPQGVFSGVSLERSHSFAKTSFDFSATADASGGLSTLSDPGLAEVLGGRPFGRGPERLAELAGGDPAEAVDLSLSVDLPGASAETWPVDWGAGPRELSASSTARNPEAWLFGLVAVLAAVGFVVTVVAIIRHARVTRPPSYLHRPGGHRRPWQEDIVQGRRPDARPGERH